MDENKLDATYWEDRYQSENTGWDLGTANSGLVAEVIERLPKSARILIPGAGRAHEALALWKAGYTNTYIVDWAPSAFDVIRAHIQATPDLRQAGFAERLIVANFFELEGQYDLILEQTFFCAIPPSLRADYVNQARNLLVPTGQWIGVLFAREFDKAGPPFGGTAAEYTQLFSKHFEIESLGSWQASVAPRAGSELLGVFRPK